MLYLGPLGELVDPEKGSLSLLSRGCKFLTPTRRCLGWFLLTALSPTHLQNSHPVPEVPLELWGILEYFTTKWNKGVRHDKERTRKSSIVCITNAVCFCLQIWQRTRVIRTPIIAKSYWMLTMCQNSVKHFKYFNLFNAHNPVGEGTITISILQMRKLRHRDIGELLTARQIVRAKANIQNWAPELVSSMSTWHVRLWPQTCQSVWRRQLKS